MRLASILLLLLSLNALAQPADIQAKSAFLAAQDAYGNGDYATAIEKLEHVKKLLGSTNPRVEHLLANAYFENEEYDKAQASLNAYFELAADSDANYLQMVRMVEMVRQKKVEAQEIAKQQAKDEAAWKEAIALQTILGYESYLKNFPSGMFTQNAKDHMKSLPPLTLVDPRDEQEYKTVRIGDQVWMAENLNYNANGADCPKNEESNCEKYGKTYEGKSIQGICPQGWRIPSSDDYIELLKYCFNPTSAGNRYTTSYYISRDEKMQLRNVEWGGTDQFGFNLQELPGITNNLATTDGGLSYYNTSGSMMFTFSKSITPTQKYFCRCVKDE